jgi:hypothetical protein
MNEAGQRLLDLKSIVPEGKSCRSAAIPTSYAPAVSIQPSNEATPHQSEADESQFRVFLVKYATHFVPLLVWP